MIGTTPQIDNLDLAEIASLRSEAHAAIKNYAAEIVGLSSAICDVDACLRQTLSALGSQEKESRFGSESGVTQ